MSDESIRKNQEVEWSPGPLPDGAQGVTEEEWNKRHASFVCVWCPKRRYAHTRSMPGPHCDGDSCWRALVELNTKPGRHPE